MFDLNDSCCVLGTRIQTRGGLSSFPKSTQRLGFTSSVVVFDSRVTAVITEVAKLLIADWLR